MGSLNLDWGFVLLLATAGLVILVFVILQTGKGKKKSEEENWTDLLMYLDQLKTGKESNFSWCLDIILKIIRNNEFKNYEEKNPAVYKMFKEVKYGKHTYNEKLKLILETIKN